MRATKGKIISVDLLIVHICILLITDLWAEQVDTEKINLKDGVQYTAEGSRDPFQPWIAEEQKTQIKKDSQATEKPLPSLVVQGIIWGGRLPQVIINNKVLKSGDTIEGVKIIKIEKSGITVLYEERPRILSSPSGISRESLKKPKE